MCQALSSEHSQRVFGALKKALKQRKLIYKLKKAHKSGENARELTQLFRNTFIRFYLSRAVRRVCINYLKFGARAGWVHAQAARRGSLAHECIPRPSQAQQVGVEKRVD
jgi:hypothetical protein